MKFVRLRDPGRDHDGMEVLLCEALHMGKMVFRTCVRTDWEAPRGDFSRSHCPIFDLDLSDSGDYYVFRSSSSHLIQELRGKTIDRNARLHLLIGHSIMVPVNWTIKPA